MSDLCCGQECRGCGGLTCKLEPGHKGYHSCVTFYCDECGKQRRGQPYHKEINSFDGVIEAQFCFTCIKKFERTKHYNPRF